MKNIFRRLVSPQALFVFYIITLVLPNILLSYTEQLSGLGVAVNILLPLGVYGLIMSLSRNVGRMVWIFLPLALLAIFQIVLLGLYGRSVIAVDMLLSFTSSNPGEAKELLGSIFPVILTVSLFYLPSLALGVVMWARHAQLPDLFIKRTRRISAAVAFAGVICLVLALTTDSGYSARNNLYPVNVAYNMSLAAKHQMLVSDHDRMTSGFTFDARDNHPDSVSEVYVLVIGETSRADHWQLNGYGRETTPRLMTRENLYSFPKAMSESNTTHKSVPLMLSHLDSHTFGDSIYNVRSIITAFREAGYNTAFISSQRPNKSFIQFFGEEADRAVYVNQRGGDSDLVLIPELERVLEEKNPRQLIVVHSYGSHFNYRDRYPREEARFLPDDYIESGYSVRDNLINAYDNSILLTDKLLDGIIGLLGESGYDRAAMIYTSDHGEDIYDDGRRLFLHSSPCPSFYQLHVPFLVWLSDSMKRDLPDVARILESNLGKRVDSSVSLFDTAMDLAGITTPRTSLEGSLVRSGYKDAERRFLNDHNRSVSLRKCGFVGEDLDRLRQLDGEDTGGE